MCMHLLPGTDYTYMIVAPRRCVISVLFHQIGYEGGTFRPPARPCSTNCTVPVIISRHTMVVDVVVAQTAARRRIY
jgi:hypothetical protein